MTYAGIVGAIQSVVAAPIFQRSAAAPPSSVKPSQREQPDNRRGRGEDTGSRPASKIPRTSGDGDKRKFSKGSRGKVHVGEETGGVLLGNVELCESPQVSISP